MPLDVNADMASFCEAAPSSECEFCCFCCFCFSDCFLLLCGRLVLLLCGRLVLHCRAEAHLLGHFFSFFEQKMRRNGLSCCSARGGSSVEHDRSFLLTFLGKVRRNEFWGGQSSCTCAVFDWLESAHLTRTPF